MCHIRAIHLLPRKNKGNVPWTIINAMIFVTEKQSISFYVLLAVRPRVVLQINQTWCTFFLVCLFLFSIRFGRMCVHHQEKQLYLCTPHNRQSSIQNNKYQVSHKYSCFSWWWAHSRPKRFEKRNKHTKKNCAPSLLYSQDLQAMSSWRKDRVFRITF